MSGSGREALPGCPEMVGKPSRMSGSGQESLLNVREWSRVPPGCPGVIGRPYRMSGSDWEALSDVRAALLYVR